MPILPSLNPGFLLGNNFVGVFKTCNSNTGGKKMRRIAIFVFCLGVVLAKEVWAFSLLIRLSLDLLFP